MSHQFWRIRGLFGALAFGGIALVFYALTGGGSALERLGMGIMGLGLFMGGAGTLALSLELLVQADVFPVKVCVRVGFILAGAGGSVMELTQALESQIWGGVAVGGILAIPFAISLMRLCRRKKRDEKES